MHGRTTRQQGPLERMPTNDTQDMSDNTNDVRTRINDRAHKVLTAISQTSGRDIAEILRDLITDYIQSEVTRAQSITAVLREDKGRAGTREGERL